MLAEREREWNGTKTQLGLELERVRGELEETNTQYQLLRDSSENVNYVCCITVRLHHETISDLKHPNVILSFVVRFVVLVTP